MNLMLPGNPRYQPKQLIGIFGYDNLVKPIVEVELATVEVLTDISVIPRDVFALLTNEVREKVLSITTTQVDETERTLTKHDIRALVVEMQKIIHELLGRYLHIPLTSYDPLETARALQYRRAYDNVLKPAIRSVVRDFSTLTNQYSDQVQVGRTHLRRALPITVGFWFATILSRILTNWEKMDEAAGELVGKISGAVGAHNAQIGLGISALCGDISFEERVLGKLGLKPARISTQILPPEPMAYFLFSCVMMSASFGQFGEDGRHLMSSEIGELFEPFDPGQSGSSTMAGKQNPINFENLVAMWFKNEQEFGKVMRTLTSNFQRDLTASAVYRDFPIILVNLMQQLNTLLGEKNGRTFLQRIRVSKEACEANLKSGANTLLGEPCYIALQLAGYKGNAYKLVNDVLVPLARERDQNLIDVMIAEAQPGSPEEEAVEAIPKDMIALLRNPERYIGDAPEQAEKIARLARQQVNESY